LAGSIYDESVADRKEKMPNFLKIKRCVELGGLIWAALICVTSCRPDEPEIRTDVHTRGILEVGPSSCKVEGEIVSIGESGISSYGFVWSDQPGPTFENGWSSDLGETATGGIFTYQIRGLTAATTYYVRAYASGGGETVFGSERSFITGELTAPTVVTYAVFNYTSRSGFSGGDITDRGGGEVLASGICWSEGRFPDLNDLHTDEGGGASSFESYMGGLEPYTVYHVRAYATNSAGTGYGQEVGFQTYWDNAILMDGDGNEYPTVQIGEQVWSAMNLRSVHYADGSPVMLVTGDTAWAALEVDARAYCFYDPDATGIETYGALYTWAAAVNGTGSGNTGAGNVQGVCPDGWHLPDDDEWKELEMELGMSALVAEKYDWRGYSEGGMLKLPGTEFWNEPNEMATNESGFNAAGSGRREDNGSLSDIGNYTGFWSSTDSGDNGALLRGLHTQRGEIRRLSVSKKEGYPVRCVKDH
jgi:uncharacterized protein (TIGR02145 family)